MIQRVLTVILAAAFALTSLGAAAQQTTNIEASVRQIATELENTQGVTCMVLERGLGLGLVKGMFKPKFGNAFMKDVTSMVIIEYSSAEAEICNSIRERITAFSQHLHEFPLGKDEAKEGEYAKCLATINDNTSISDFMFLLEDNENKMFLYMGGSLNLDKLEFNM